VLPSKGAVEEHARATAIQEEDIESLALLRAQVPEEGAALQAAGHTTVEVTDRDRSAKNGLAAGQAPPSKVLVNSEAAGESAQVSTLCPVLPTSCAPRLYWNGVYQVS